MAIDAELPKFDNAADRQRAEEAEAALGRAIGTLVDRHVAKYSEKKPDGSREYKGYVCLQCNAIDETADHPDKMQHTERCLLGNPLSVSKLSEYRAMISLIDAVLLFALNWTPMQDGDEITIIGDADDFDKLSDAIDVMYKIRKEHHHGN